VSDPGRLDEFALIARHFAPLARRAPLAYDLKDDAAVLRPPLGYDVVLTADCMVAGVHFFADDDPGHIARKLLRVNLSDLAAKGATPMGYLLTAGFPPTIKEDWIAAFAAGLGADQREYGIDLLGGDTVASPGPMTFTIAACGRVPCGSMIRRSGAKAGDHVYVSGSVGDAALALAIRKGQIAPPPAADAAFLRGRFLLPEPRLGLGQGLIGVASACIDVSDGLIQDVGHIAATSKVGCEIWSASIPLSPAAAAIVAAEPARLAELAAGGDDYELAFTAPPAAEQRIAALSAGLGVTVTRIGRVRVGQGVVVLDPQGAPMDLKRTGYRHF
jgi:thiamine-monophosphate kinase